ncbi:hypothetical protein ACF1AY_04040 [Streptomyces sp. NPDC014776]|uniref:hypothetical protein n=1 Tax=unclassified Streptomyces TaxID=2593676 RepID=UPI0036F4F9DA
MKIDESLVRELLEAPSDDTVLVLVEGSAHVVDQTALSSERYRGAAVVMSHAELMERLGTRSPAEADAPHLAAALQDAVDKLGA